MTAIPCKRPRVTVDIFGDQRWQADCYVPGCRWGYGNVVKTDVEEQARRHRAEHRNAFPATDVAKNPLLGVWFASCECGWDTDAPGQFTKSGAVVNLDYHLITEHGAVIAR